MSNVHCLSRLLLFIFSLTQTLLSTHLTELKCRKLPPEKQEGWCHHAQFLAQQSWMQQIVVGNGRDQQVNKDRGSFCVWAQPMTDDVTLKRRHSYKEWSLNISAIRSPANRLFFLTILFRIIAKKISKLRITSPLWGQSTGHWLIVN